MDYKFNEFGEFGHSDTFNSLSLICMGGDVVEETFQPNENYHFHFDDQNINGYSMSNMTEDYAGTPISGIVVVNMDYLAFHLTMAIGRAMEFEASIMG